MIWCGENVLISFYYCVVVILFVLVCRNLFLWYCFCMFVICNLDFYFVKDKLFKNVYNFVRYEFIDIYKIVVCVFLVFFIFILINKIKNVDKVFYLY